MERKIGEIFEYNGEWYQCLKLAKCYECAFNGKNCDNIRNSRGYCIAPCRSDRTDVHFKKLEKVGEPFIDEAYIQFQRYKIYTEPIIDSAENIGYANVKNTNVENTIAIEIKQNKEDMEEKKLNLKPFDIQKAREGKPVCTRDGRKARIICFDRIDSTGCNLSIVALIQCEGTEVLQLYRDDGKRGVKADLDLMMLPEKKEGWVNIYKGDDKRVAIISNAYDTKEKALNKIDEVLEATYITTRKIEWEE